MSRAVDGYLDQSSLHDHQREAIRAIAGQFQDHTKSKIALVQLPTGCGKTGVAVVAPYVLSAKRVLVITPSVEVAQQMHDSFTGLSTGRPFLVTAGFTAGNTDAEKLKFFQDYCIPSTVLVEEASQLPHYTRDSSQHLVITNAQKIGGASSFQPQHLDPTSFDVVIVDEAHHYPAPTWRTLVDSFPQSYIIFLTATAVWRGKYILGDAIGQVPEIPRCYFLDRQTAVARGIIRPLRFLEVGRPGDSEVKAAEEIATAIAQALYEHDKQDATVVHKAMVLAQTIDGINSATDFKNAYDDITDVQALCDIYAGKKSTPRIVTAFKTRSNPRVLVVCGKLLEGFDHKSVSVAAIYRNVAEASEVMFTQFVGRCVRRCSRDDPVEAVVISHVNCNQRPNYDNLDTIPDA